MEEKLNNVKDMIDDAMKKSTKLKVATLGANWEKIIGPLYTECSPEYIKDGVLSIILNGAVLNHYIQSIKDEIIDKVNGFFGEEVIVDIKTRIGKAQELESIKLDTKIEEQKKESVEDVKSEKKEFSKGLEGDILDKILRLQRLSQERDEYLLSQGNKKCKICGMIYEGEEDYCRVCIDSGKLKEQKKYHNEYEYYEYDEEYDEE